MIVFESHGHLRVVFYHLLSYNMGRMTVPNISIQYSNPYLSQKIMVMVND